MKSIIAFSALLLAFPALAHEAKGPHGGRQVDAGQMHVELITKGPAVEVYVADGAGKPVDASGYKGLAILVVGGKPARILVALREPQRHSAQHAPPHRSYFHATRKRPVAHPRVYHNHRHTLALALMQHPRPQLALHQHQRRRS